MKTSTNPYNGELLYEFEGLSKDAVEQKIAIAHDAFMAWKNVSFEQRSDLLYKAGQQLRANAQRYAKTITREMGKPITQSLAEIEKCAWVCDYYAKHATSQLDEVPIETDAHSSYVRYEPLGVILAIMPWNYPFWQVFRFAAPNLMAGNVGVLKHASNVMQCATLIQEVFEVAGFPTGCFQNLIIDTKAIKQVVENDYIKGVTLTGSTPAGASVASLAGKQIKKSVLELGGSNALIVYQDADIEAAIATCLQARFQNTGQSCIAGKRLLVHQSIAANFTKRLVAEVEKLKVGNPFEEDTYISVLAREDLAVDLENQVNKSIKLGAKLETGGKRNGTFFQPTILSLVTADMPIFKEETFGPAIGITTFKSDQQAVALSNASDFGLGVSLFTTNIDRIKKYIPQFNEGAVFINEMVKSDPRLPFGGIKTSGYGRELSGYGIKEFMNVKTVYIKKFD